jgi:hypothetical protein
MAQNDDYDVMSIEPRLIRLSNVDLRGFDLKTSLTAIRLGTGFNPAARAMSRAAPIKTRGPLVARFR